MRTSRVNRVSLQTDARMPSSGRALRTSPRCTNKRGIIQADFSIDDRNRSRPTARAPASNLEVHATGRAVDYFFASAQTCARYMLCVW